MKKYVVKIIKFILRYLLNILLGIDHLSNAVFFLGDADETISAHLGRVYPNSVMTKIVNTLFFWQHEHCFRAWVNEQKAVPGDDDLIK